MMRENDSLGEDNGTAHIFDGFAIVNALLCSAVKKPPAGRNAGKGASSRLMRNNCARHFCRTMEILEPTVIVAEGQGVRSWIGGPPRTWVEADLRLRGSRDSRSRSNCRRTSRHPDLQPSVGGRPVGLVGEVDRLAILERSCRAHNPQMAKPLGKEPTVARVPPIAVRWLSTSHLGASVVPRSSPT